MPDRNSALLAFQAAFADKADLALDSYLADRVTLKPPTYAKVWTGKTIVARLLSYAAANIDRLVYKRTYETTDSFALYFEAEIAGIGFSGVDLITFDDQDRIVDIEIIARPPKAVAELSQRMAVSIQGDALFQP